jgi:hypothetical protein
VTNTLAYYDTELITTIKGFILEAPEGKKSISISSKKNFPSNLGMEPNRIKTFLILRLDGISLKGHKKFNGVRRSRKKMTAFFAFSQQL